MCVICNMFIVIVCCLYLKITADCATRPASAGSGASTTCPWDGDFKSCCDFFLVQTFQHGSDSIFKKPISPNPSGTSGWSALSKVGENHGKSSDLMWFAHWQEHQEPFWWGKFMQICCSWTCWTCWEWLNHLEPRSSAHSPCHTSLHIAIAPLNVPCKHCPVIPCCQIADNFVSGLDPSSPVLCLGRWHGDTNLAIEVEN